MPPSHTGQKSALDRGRGVRLGQPALFPTPPHKMPHSETRHHLPFPHGALDVACVVMRTSKVATKIYKRAFGDAYLICTAAIFLFLVCFIKYDVCNYTRTNFYISPPASQYYNWICVPPKGCHLILILGIAFSSHTKTPLWHRPFHQSPPRRCRRSSTVSNFPFARFLFFAMVLLFPHTKCQPGLTQRFFFAGHAAWSCRCFSDKANSRSEPRARWLGTAVDTDAEGSPIAIGRGSWAVAGGACRFLGRTTAGGCSIEMGRDRRTRFGWTSVESSRAWLLLGQGGTGGIVIHRYGDWPCM